MTMERPTTAANAITQTNISFMGLTSYAKKESKYRRIISANSLQPVGDAVNQNTHFLDEAIRNLSYYINSIDHQCEDLQFQLISLISHRNQNSDGTTESADEHYIASRKLDKSDCKILTENTLVTKSTDDAVYDSSNNIDKFNVGMIENNIRCQLRSNDINIPENYLSDLIHIVQERTDIDTAKVTEAITTTLRHMQETLPCLSNSLQAILNLPLNANTEAEFIGSSNTLSEIFMKLRLCLNQQAKDSKINVDDDDEVILDLLERLLEGLNENDPASYDHLIQQDDYYVVHILVSYFQLSCAISSKLLLAQIFGVICYTVQDVITVLLHSVLPTELGLSMRTELMKDKPNIQLLSYYSLLSSILLASEEPLPNFVYDEWNSALIEILMEKIERPLASDESMLLPELFVKIILSFNLHMKDPAQNLIIKALESEIKQEFCNSLILLFNRSVGTAAVAPNQSPLAVIKMMIDIFSSTVTASIFYTNDIKVILDVILRNLVDLPSGDNIRSWNLCLLNKIASVDVMHDSFYRSEEFSVLLRNLYSEEPCFDREQIEELWLNFPAYFKEF